MGVVNSASTEIYGRTSCWPVMLQELGPGEVRDETVGEGILDGTAVKDAGGRWVRQRPVGITSILGHPRRFWWGVLHPTFWALVRMML
jgi:hypothetical protein